MHNEDQFSRLFDLSESGRRFSQLTAEEQDLVMEVMGAADEYDAMVAMQPAMDKVFSAEPQLEPDLEMRRAVLGVPQRSPRIWLNSFWLMIWPAEMPVYRRPGFQFASVAALVSLVWVATTLNPSKDDGQMAVNESKDSASKSAESVKEEVTEEEQAAEFVSEGTLKRQESIVSAETSTTSTLNDALDTRQATSGASETPPVEITGIVFSGNSVPAKSDYTKDDEMLFDEVAVASSYKDADRNDKVMAATEDRKMAKEAAPGSSGKGSAKSIPATNELIDLLYTAY